MTVTLDTAELKQLIRDALGELLQEHREDFQEIMAEILEDAAMSKAIEEEGNSTAADKDVIFQILEGEE